MRSLPEQPTISTRPTAGCAHRIGVVFDVDGTLVDSERDGHRVAFNLAFEEAGLDYRWDVDTYGRLLGITGGRRRLERFLREDGWSGSQPGRIVFRRGGVGEVGLRRPVGRRHSPNGPDRAPTGRVLPPAPRSLSEQPPSSRRNRD